MANGPIDAATLSLRSNLQRLYTGKPSSNRGQHMGGEASLGYLVIDKGHTCAEEIV